jgi:hypothetical protein
MRGAAERVLGRRRTGVLVMFRAVPYWNRPKSGVRQPRRSRRLEAVRGAPSAVFSVHRLATVVDAVGLRLRAIGELVQEVGELGVAVLLDQLGDVVAAVTAAGSHSIESVGTRKSERVWAFSLMRVALAGLGGLALAVAAHPGLDATPLGRGGVFHLGPCPGRAAAIAAADALPWSGSSATSVAVEGVSLVAVESAGSLPFVRHIARTVPDLPRLGLFIVVVSSRVVAPITEGGARCLCLHIALRMASKTIANGM